MDQHGGPGHGRVNVDLLVVYAAHDELLSELASEGGFAARVARTMVDAVQEILRSRPDAVLVLAQDEAAVETCEVLRALGDFPIVVSPRPLAAGIVTGCLDAGADVALGYLVPPAEMAARIESVVRRGIGGGQVVRVGELVINLADGIVVRRGQRVDLTPTEFRLLAVLAEHAGHAVTSRELLRHVWGNDYVDDLQYVRLYIGYLRAKLEDDPARPQYIVTQRAVGYRLETPPHLRQAH